MLSALLLSTSAFLSTPAYAHAHEVVAELGALRLAVLLIAPIVAFAMLLRTLLAQSRIRSSSSSKKLTTMSNNEPPMLPYLLPGIAHAIYIAIDIEAVFRQAVARFGFGPPFTLSVAGRSLYIFTDPRDVAEIFRRAKTLTFARFLPFTLRRVCNTSAEGVALMQADTARIHSGSSSSGSSNGEEGAKVGEGGLEIVHHFFSSRLSPSASLDAIAAQFQHDVRTALSPSAFPSTLDAQRDRLMSGHGAAGAGAVDVSSYQWTRRFMARTSIRILFGPTLLAIDSALPSHIWTFEDGLYIVASGLPRFLRPAPYAAREAMTAALQRWIELGAYRTEAAVFVRESVEHCLAKGLTNRDAASVMLGILLATQANAATGCWWALMHTASDGEILRAVEREVGACGESSSSSSSSSSAGTDMDVDVDMDVDMDACPTLSAVYHEVLRFYAASPSHRMAEEATTLGGYSIPKDAFIIAPIRQSHLQPSTWGADADVFEPRRFLRRPELAKSPMFRPYGGGNSLCSGRFLAKREFFTFVVEMLREFEVEVRDALPAGYDKRSGAGLLCPKDKDVDVRMVLRRRSWRRTRTTMTTTGF